MVAPKLLDFISRPAPPGAHALPPEPRRPVPERDDSPLALELARISAVLVSIMRPVICTTAVEFDLLDAADAEAPRHAAQRAAADGWSSYRRGQTA